MEPPGHLSDALSVVITLLLLPVFGLIENQTSCFRPKRLGHDYASGSILNLNAMPTYTKLQMYQMLSNCTYSSVSLFLSQLLVPVVVDTKYIIPELLSSVITYLLICKQMHNFIFKFLAMEFIFRHYRCFRKYKFGIY